MTLVLQGMMVVEYQGAYQVYSGTVVLCSECGLLLGQNYIF